MNAINSKDFYIEYDIIKAKGESNSPFSHIKSSFSGIDCLQLNVVYLNDEQIIKEFNVDQELLSLNLKNEENKKKFNRIKFYLKNKNKTPNITHINYTIILNDEKTNFKIKIDDNFDIIYLGQILFENGKFIFTS